MSEYALYFRDKQISIWHPDLYMILREACDQNGIILDSNGQIKLREHFRIERRSKKA